LQPLVLHSWVGPILASFEGKLSRDEISEKFLPNDVPRDVIGQLITLLDENLFMVSPRYFAAERQVKEAFLEATTRQAALAGLGYAGSRDALQTEIDGYINTEIVSDLPKKGVLGIMSPHIDYHRGSKVYGKSWQALKGAEDTLFVIFGTAHQYSRHMFHLTRKDFENPIGTTHCDRAFVDRLSKRYGKERSFADEILHKREHSIELQLPFLLRKIPGASIAPVLVGSFYAAVSAGKLPSEWDDYESFVAALTECLKEEMKSGRDVCFLAGVDMAHVGTHFGDPSRLDDSFLDTVKKKDMAYIDALAKQDKRLLFETVMADSDATRICGFPTMYTVVDLFDRLDLRYDFRLISYEQSVDLENDRCVTFAGAGFYEV